MADRPVASLRRDTGVRSRRAPCSIRRRMFGFKSRPPPGDAADQDRVPLGRVREDVTQPEPGLSLWTVNDNLRKGAALNAIQIAELV
jgi:aspartate-semialdehyde dehydrogenase